MCRWSDPEAPGVLPRVVADVGGEEGLGDRRSADGDEERAVDLEGRRRDRGAPHAHLDRRARPRSLVVHLEGRLLHRFGDVEGLVGEPARTRLEPLEPVELLRRGEVDHGEDESLVAPVRFVRTPEELVGHAVELEQVGGRVFGHADEHLLTGLGREHRHDRTARLVTAQLDVAQLGGGELAQAVDVELRPRAGRAPVHEHVEHRRGEESVGRAGGDLRLPPVLPEEVDVVRRVARRVRGDLLDPLELCEAGVVGLREPHPLAVRDRSVDPIAADDLARGAEGRDGRVAARSDTRLFHVQTPELVDANPFLHAMRTSRGH